MLDVWPGALDADELAGGVVITLSAALGFVGCTVIVAGAGGVVVALVSANVKAVNWSRMA